MNAYFMHFRDWLVCYYQDMEDWYSQNLRRLFCPRMLERLSLVSNLN